LEKDLLEGWRSNNGGRERVSSGPSILEMNQERKKMTVVAGPGGINTPKAQQSFMGGTVLP
jgi:hypothetical protein